MLKIISIIIVTAIFAIGCFGCAQFNMAENETQLEKNWGRSFESARYNQLLNPETENNLDPVEGLEGPKAESILKGYLNNQTAELETDAKDGF